MRFRLSVWVVATALLVWVGLILVSPLAVPAGSLQDLDGTVGVMDHASVYGSLPAPFRGVYVVGDRLCHQREDRSFVVGSNEMAFCARCTGVWIGMLLGVVVMALVEFPVDSRLVWVVVAGLVPMMVDGGGQFLGWWVSSNPVRLVTGLFAGGIGGVAIGLIIIELGGMVKRKTISG